MTDSTKTILTVAGVGAGLYILYKVVSTPPTQPLSLNPFGPTSANSTASAFGSFFGGLLGGATRPASGPLPVTPAASGGGASPVSAGGYVDPTSGLYYASNGAAPVAVQPANFSPSAAYAPGAGPYTPYAPGASAPGPYAPAPSIVSDGSGDTLLTAYA